MKAQEVYFCKAVVYCFTSNGLVSEYSTLMGVFLLFVLDEFHFWKKKSTLIGTGEVQYLNKKTS